MIHENAQHADGMIIAHVVGPNLVYVTDLISPRGPVGRTPGTVAVGDAMRKAGIANENDSLSARRDEALAARTLSMVVWERRQVAVRLAAATGGGWSSK